jgi:hypothetical protein
MYHPNHPDASYRLANRVQVFDPPNAVSWEPGQDTDDGSLTFGGWVWRYDLAPAGPSETNVTLSYDWSRGPGRPAATHRLPPIPCGSLGQLARPSRRTRRLVGRRWKGLGDGGAAIGDVQLAENVLQVSSDSCDRHD